MERFEEGKRYKVNGGGIIEITKRTGEYITFKGDFSGKRKIINDNLFGLGENILIPSGYTSHKYFCFAANGSN